MNYKVRNTLQKLNCGKFEFPIDRSIIDSCFTRNQVGHKICYLQTEGGSSVLMDMLKAKLFNCGK